MSMTVLLTGATGFVGHHVLELLLQEGYTVVCFGRRGATSSTQTGKLVNVIGDLATGSGFQEVPWGELDAVVHLAASGVKAKHRVWADALSVNVVGTQRLLAAVADLATRVPAVFVARTFYEHLVGQAPALLENPYIATKLAASELASLWAESYQGATILGTFFQVYGPGDDAGNVLSYAAGEIKAGRPAVFGSGRGLRDWIYITDAASAVIQSIKTSNPGMRELDIGTGTLVSIRTAIESLAEVNGGGSITFDAIRDRPDVDLVMAASRQVEGWRPMVSLQQGLSNLYIKL
jgi:UDP-glucose 4-epimerase